MCFAVLLAAAALAQPTDVLEQWEFVSRAPLLEEVTARGVYRVADGTTALLPAAVQGGDAPHAYAVGVPGDLRVTRAAEGWSVQLPATNESTVRIVASRIDHGPEARLFRLEWPQVAAATVPTRRTVDAPRDALVRIPSDWSCADDASDTIPCVSTARAPRPLLFRVTPPRPRAGAMLLTLLAVVAAFVAAVFAKRAGRNLRAAGAVAGLVVGASVALAVAGALRLGWPAAILSSVVPSVAIGAFAAERAASRTVGAVALFALPLLAVTDGRFVHVVAAAGVAIAGAVVARVVGREPAITAAESADPVSPEVERDSGGAS